MKPTQNLNAFSKQYILRPASITDIPLLLKVREQAGKNLITQPLKLTSKIFSDYLSLYGKGWVCIQNAEIVGYVICSKKESSIWGLFVLPTHQHKGIGTQLLNQAVSWLRDQNIKTAYLSTQKNTYAAQFYKRQGWVETGCDKQNHISLKLESPESVNVK